MSYRCLLVFVVLSLSGCALHHGRGADPDPTPEPTPDPTPDCPPGGPPEPCSLITESGCLDPSQMQTAIARGCGSECPAGYGRIGDGLEVCEDMPAPMCGAGVAEWRAWGIPDGEATVARIDIDGGSAELVLSAPVGEATATVPVEHADVLAVGEPVEVINDNEGGVQLTRIVGARSSITVVTANVGWPEDGLRIGGVHLTLGELACAATSSPPECGIDESFALDVAMEGEDFTLAPGEFDMRRPLVLDGSLYLLTHGGATRWGADGCEVFVPWAIHVVLSEHYGMS